MTELAKQLGFTLEPFCVCTEHFTEQEIADLLDRCVDLGAGAEEAYGGLDTCHKFNEKIYGYGAYEYTGVDEDLLTWVEDGLNCYHNNYLTREEALVYLQLTPQDGRLVGNETLEPLLEDDFIPWSGGECPVPKGTIVHVKYRDGEESIVTALLWTIESNYRLISGTYSAVGWSMNRSNSDIIAYKVYKGSVSPVEGSSTETNTNTKGSEQEAPMQAPVGMIKGEVVTEEEAYVLQLVLNNLRGDYIRELDFRGQVVNTGLLSNKILCILEDPDYFVSDSQLDQRVVDIKVKEAQNTLNDLIKRREELNK